MPCSETPVSTEHSTSRAGVTDGRRLRHPAPARCCWLPAPAPARCCWLTGRLRGQALEVGTPRALTQLAGCSEAGSTAQAPQDATGPGAWSPLQERARVSATARRPSCNTHCNPSGPPAQPLPARSLRKDTGWSRISPPRCHPRSDCNPTPAPNPLPWTVPVCLLPCGGTVLCWVAQNSTPHTCSCGHSPRSHGSAFFMQCQLNSMPQRHQHPPQELPQQSGARQGQGGTHPPREESLGPAGEGQVTVPPPQGTARLDGH